MKSIDPKELHALIQLLDDTDNEVYTHVKDKLLTLGEPVIPELEDAWEHSFNHLLQQRIEELIHRIQFDGLEARLREWKEHGQSDLLKGALLVARYQYPDLDEEPLKRTLEQIKKDVWVELNDDLTALEKIKVVNHILFDTYGFNSNKTNFHAPPNNYLNQVIESKKGNPLSLSVVYIIVAQALGIPVYGVNLPEHFILAYTDDDSPRDLFNVTKQKKVLFYLNPFSRGSMFSRREIDTFLNQLKIAKRQEFYLPCTNQDIIRRLITNLIYAYEGMGYKYKVEELKRLQQIVS